MEVVGQLRGRLGVSRQLPFHNISGSGALVETRQALPLLSIHRMRLFLDDLDVEVEVRVRRLQQMAEHDGRVWHLMALEFVRLPPILIAKIDRLEEEASAAGRSVSDV